MVSLECPCGGVCLSDGFCARLRLHSCAKCGQHKNLFLAGDYCQTTQGDLIYFKLMEVFSFIKCVYMLCFNVYQ